jgi:hypothetical protein
MIDTNSGAIAFDDQLNINSQTRLAEMEAISKINSAPSQPGRTQLSIGSRLFQGGIWGVGLVFNERILSQIWLQCLNADGVDTKTWSLENEKLRKVTHDMAVKKICSSSGNPVQSASSLTYEFSWGSISSVLDVRGVQALVLVEYS